MKVGQMVAEMVAAQSTTILVEVFEMTEADPTPESLTIRGWIMDELERRDEPALWAWIDSNEGSPRRFFLK